MAKGRKAGSKVRSANEILQSYSREDVVSTIREYREIQVALLTMDAVIKSIRESNLSEADKNLITQKYSGSEFRTRDELVSKLRRIAVTIIRAQGPEAMIQIVEENLESIPLGSDKTVSTQFAHNVSNANAEV